MLSKANPRRMSTSADVVTICNLTLTLIPRSAGIRGRRRITGKKGNGLTLKPIA